LRPSCEGGDHRSKYRFQLWVSTSATTPARILIVDDDTHVRALVRRLLERASYVCATAENEVMQRAVG